MNFATARSLLLMICLLVPIAATVDEAPRRLQVHLVAPNNQSPYAFVRAKFETGELADRWAVKFFDDAGTEIPYFVWDSITWRIACPESFTTLPLRSLDKERPCRSLAVPFVARVCC